MQSEKNNTKRISLNVSSEFKDEILKRAKLSNRTISSYIIRACEQTPIYVIEGLPQLINEVRSVGNNINQLTKIANTQKYIDKDVVENLQNIKKELSDIEEKISKLLFTTDVIAIPLSIYTISVVYKPILDVIFR